MLPVQGTDDHAVYQLQRSLTLATTTGETVKSPAAPKAVQYREILTFQAEIITGNHAKAGPNRPGNWRQEDNVVKLNIKFCSCLIISGLNKINK